MKPLTCARTSVRFRLSAATSRAAIDCWWLAAACSAWRRALSKASSEIVIAGVSLDRRPNWSRSI